MHLNSIKYTKQISLFLCSKSLILNFDGNLLLITINITLCSSTLYVFFPLSRFLQVFVFFSNFTLISFRAELFIILLILTEKKLLNKSNHAHYLYINKCVTDYNSSLQSNWAWWFFKPTLRQKLSNFQTWIIIFKLKFIFWKIRIFK